MGGNKLRVYLSPGGAPGGGLFSSGKTKKNSGDDFVAEFRALFKVIKMKSLNLKVKTGLIGYFSSSKSRGFSL